MPTVHSKPSREDATSASLVALLPLTAILPALLAMSADRLSTPVRAVLVVAELALIAATGALAARTAADRARRDAEVLDALEPLAGARR
ncbi:hypothetical protein ACFWUZ_22135 [Streptomyces sp. NPDC058646]|uniref:hypothetical protein n=1 Tax=Streptomyces sp. NPDC058646 TaxID=3346574 RepID=UPI00364F8FBB